MADTTELAPAKLNLCLHVTGQRPDGYHTLDSLVVFADVGDLLEAEPATRFSLTLDGPFAMGLGTGDDNLVIRAARLMGGGAAIRLVKNLPVAAGIGGGSADAAAVLRLLSRQTGQPLPDGAGLARLGADVPVCLSQAPQRMRGIGERLTPVPALPPMWCVLANSGRMVRTPEVFAALQCRQNPGLPDLPAALPDFDALIGYLADTRNDLEPAALRVDLSVGEVLAALRTLPGCALARMSGSGGTCFALFDNATAAIDAATDLRLAHPGWWVSAARILDGAR